jgi:hypothetical protein
MPCLGDCDMDYKLELVLIPVSDVEGVDESKAERGSD